MRIVGGKDYYDGAAAYGIDPGIVFVRDTRKITKGELAELGNWASPSITLFEDIEIPEDPPRGWSRQSASSRNDSYSTGSNVINRVQYLFIGHVILFCGKVYRGITIEHYPEHQSYNKEQNHFWNADRLRRWAAERGLGVETAGGWRSRGTRMPLDEMFESTEVDEKTTQAMIKYGVAIAYKRESDEYSRYSYNSVANLALDSGWRANTDGLKDIGFQSAVDPVTAFQELSMWVGGTLSATNGPNVVKITDDNVKLAKHGMDKWSFRKQGPKSKL